MYMQSQDREGRSNGVATSLLARAHRRLAADIGPDQSRLEKLTTTSDKLKAEIAGLQEKLTENEAKIAAQAQVVSSRYQLQQALLHTNDTPEKLAAWLRAKYVEEIKLSLANITEINSHSDDVPHAAKRAQVGYISQRPVFLTAIFDQGIGDSAGIDRAALLALVGINFLNEDQVTWAVDKAIQAGYLDDTQDYTIAKSQLLAEVVKFIKNGGRLT